MKPLLDQLVEIYCIKIGKQGPNYNEEFPVIFKLIDIIKEQSEALIRVDKWTIDPVNLEIDENFSKPGCRQFIKDVADETLTSTESKLKSLLGEDFVESK